MNGTSATETVAKAYFEAWTSRDSERVKSLLDEKLKFSFVSDGIFVVEGREKFLSGEAWPQGVKVTLVSDQRIRVKPRSKCMTRSTGRPLCGWLNSLLSVTALFQISCLSPTRTHMPNSKPDSFSLPDSLIDVDDSVLIVIDVQENFLRKYPAEERELLLSRISWLISVATKLSVPLIVTAEDMPNLGGSASPIADRLPADVHTYNKMIFGLADDPDILAAVKDTGRGTAVLIGLETDVCVAHSALGLVRNGFQVVVVADATGSPANGHQVGLERMRRAGVLVSSVKSLYYEWVRTVDRDNEFSRKYGREIGHPKDIIL